MRCGLVAPGVLHRWVRLRRLPASELPAGVQTDGLHPGLGPAATLPPLGCFPVTWVWLEGQWCFKLLKLKSHAGGAEFGTPKYAFWGY